LFNLGESQQKRVAKPPTHVDEEPFISDYLKLYESFASFMIRDFESCRWTNFGNAGEIMEACRDFVPIELWNDESVKSQILRDSK